MDSFNLRNFREAYEAIYCEQENIFEDIVDFCSSINIFESIEETEYFANLIIENDLVETFIDDALEYYYEEQILDESYVVEARASAILKGLKAVGGAFKKPAKVATGLSTKTMVKQGLRPTGLSSKGKALSGAAKTDDIARTQAARASRKPPSPEKANKYGEMLAAKKAAAPKPAAPKSGGMTPSYVAKRGVTDTLATTLALGMGHMAGLKPATNAMRQMVTPVVRSAGKVAERTPPTVTKAATKVAKGVAADPWKQFPKTSGKPKQLGLPKEGPSSKLPNRTLPGAPTPKALPAAGKTSAPKTTKPTFKPEALPKTPKAAQPAGALVPTRGPKPTFKPEALPKTTPGSAQRSALPAEIKSSTKPSKGTSGGGSTGSSRKGGGLTHTVRATLSPTEKTGNMKYPGLEKYATGSGPGTGGAKPPKKSMTGRIAAGAAGAAALAAAADSEREQRKQQKAVGVSNIQKPKKKVTGEDVRKSFDTAFATERKLKGSSGTFRWTNPSTGKSSTYTTKMRGESIDNFDLVLDALLVEGYTNDEALKIMSTLDEGSIAKLAAGAIKGVIKSVGPKLTKTKLPPEVSPQRKAMQLAIKQLGINPKALMGTPQARNAAVAARSAKKPQAKPTKRDPFPNDVYSKDSLGGIRGYRSGD